MWGFSLGGLAVAFVGVMGFYMNDVAMIESRRVIEVNTKLVEHGQRMRANINMLRRYEKDLFLNVGDSAAMAKYQKSWTEAREHAKQRMEQLARLETASKGQASLSEINGQLEAYAKGFASVVAQIESGAIRTPVEANRAIGQFKESTHKAEAAITAYATEEDKAIAQVVKDLDASNRRGQMIMAGTLLVTIVGLAVFATGLIRSIRKPLKDIAHLVTDMGQGQGDLTH